MSSRVELEAESSGGDMNNIGDLKARLEANSLFTDVAFHPVLLCASTASADGHDIIFGEASLVRIHSKEIRFSTLECPKSDFR